MKTTYIQPQTRYCQVETEQLLGIPISDVQGGTDTGQEGGQYGKQGLDIWADDDSQTPTDDGANGYSDGSALW